MVIEHEISKGMYSPKLPENDVKSRNTRNPRTPSIHILKIYIYYYFREIKGRGEREQRERVRERKRGLEREILERERGISRERKSREKEGFQREKERVQRENERGGLERERKVNHFPKGDEQDKEPGKETEMAWPFV